MNRHELPSKRGLAALPRAQERDHAAALQCHLNQTDVGFAIDHAGIIYLEIPVVDAGFSRCWQRENSSVNMMTPNTLSR
jgi:hypothetical protein